MGRAGEAWGRLRFESEEVTASYHSCFPNSPVSEQLNPILPPRVGQQRQRARYAINVINGWSLCRNKSATRITASPGTSETITECVSTEESVLDDVNQFV
jgi:hypothetical protein